MGKNNILLICPKFYDYQQMIADELRKRYEGVYVFSEYPLGTPIRYFTAEKIPGVKKMLWRIYVNKIIKLTRKVTFLKILIIRGNLLPTSLLDYLAEIPNCELIYYQWDSVKNNPNALEILKYAKKSFTFDKSDAERYPYFKYVPLFYSINNNRIVQQKEDIDILYVGTWSFERFESIKGIDELCQNSEIKLYSHLVIHYLSYIRRYKQFKNYPLKWFKFKSLKYNQYMNLLERSNSVLDIPSKTQIGTSMRTIEALSLGKKVITTNAHVQNEIFYRKENFLIWPQEKDRLKEFMTTPFNEESLSNINSLHSWLLSIGV